MDTSVDTLAEEALQLSSDQRLSLAHRLLTSIEPAVNDRLETAWDAEIQQRIRRYEAGDSAATPTARVFAELDAKLKR